MARSENTLNPALRGAAEFGHQRKLRKQTFVPLIWGKYGGQIQHRIGTNFLPGVRTRQK